MGGFLRPDLQTLLAQAPNGTPDMPVFEEGAIPPVLGPQFPDPNELETIEAPVSEELGPVSVGQPVPPVKQSRGDRLRALLGDFLQNFGTGLQAASRAPSGAGFAAGFGAALSAPEERRQQQAREGLLRENQKFRQQIAQQQQEAREEALAIQEQSRLDRQANINRQSIFRREERTQRRFRDILESRTRKREKEESRTFLKGQQQGRIGAIAEQGRLGRKLQRELATTSDAGKQTLSVKDAYSIAARNVQVALGAEPFLDSDKTIKDFSQASREIQRQAAQILQDANGRKPSKEEIAAIAPNIDRLRPFIKEIGEAMASGTATEQELRLVIKEALANGEINEADARLLANGFGLALPPTSALDRIRGREPTRVREEAETVTRPGRFPSFVLPASPRR